MVFSDLFFIFVFLPAFILFYVVGTYVDKKLLSKVDGHDSFLVRNIMLVIFSLMFYAWGEPVYIFLMLLSVVINYFAGLGIAATKRWRKVWLWIGVGLDILILGCFKYLGFFADSLGIIGLQVDVPRLALPIGISFYIFQSISYLVDVYRGETPVQRRFLDLLLYIAMFPQLIAGPIVRYGTVAHELHHRHVTSEDLAEGAYRFFIGLGKKVIISNMLYEIATGFLVDSIDSLSMWGAWIGMAAFVLQIYFDFSGYSDMAIGMGRAMGFHFNENFDHPYCSRSITEFWRRWHMSMGSFFRDYAYIPMGGNRRHQMLNILTVWFLTGLWHGAAWNFVIWGLYFGLILVIEKYTLMKVVHRIPAFLLHVYTIMIVFLGFSIFYFDNFENMGKWIHSAFGQASLSFGIEEQTALTDNFWLWIIALIFCMPLRRKLEEFTTDKLGNVRGGMHVIHGARAVASAILLILSVALLVGATNNAFIYTRF